MHSPAKIFPCELKFQCWRALAVLEDGSERLLYVGRSAPHVQSSYAGAFAELLDGSERAGVQRIALECWEGASDCGRWVARTKLVVPGGPEAAPGSAMPRERAGAARKAAARR